MAAPTGQGTLGHLGSLTTMRLKHGSYSLAGSGGASSVNTVSYLVVASGASADITAGGTSGGGGAGGMLQGTMTAPVGAVTVTVGAGGVSNSNGNPSVFSSVSTIGGGKSGSNVAAQSGGSGGGGGNGNPYTTAGLGTVGQGNDGGVGVHGGRSGGGGGAGQVGFPCIGTTAGAGGAGLQWTVNSLFYAGGGGGGGYESAGGAGGNGGGGAGGQYPANGTNGSSNTGGGGGGVFNGPTAGLGGSGIVILRYADSFAALTGGSGLTGFSTPVVSGGFRTYTFTAGTGTVTFP